MLQTRILYENTFNVIFVQQIHFYIHKTQSIQAEYITLVQVGFDLSVTLVQVSVDLSVLG